MSISQGHSYLVIGAQAEVNRFNNITFEFFKQSNFKLNIYMDVESAHLDEIEPDKGKVYYYSYPHFDIHLHRII